MERVLHALMSATTGRNFTSHLGHGQLDSNILPASAEPSHIFGCVEEKALTRPEFIQTALFCMDKMQRCQGRLGRV